MTKVLGLLSLVLERTRAGPLMRHEINAKHYQSGVLAERRINLAARRINLMTYCQIELI